MEIDRRVAGYLGRVLTSDGGPAGTCFQLRPGVLVTACHVLDDLGLGELGAVTTIDPLQRGATREAVVLALDRVHDLAVLRAEASLPDSLALVHRTDEQALGDPVSVTGAPHVDDRSSYRHLDARGEWAGSTTRDDVVPLGRLRSSDVLPGMSGAPVVGAAAGNLLGVVSGRYNSNDGWLRDSVWVARTENLQELLRSVSEELRVGVPEPEELGGDLTTSRPAPSSLVPAPPVRWPVTYGRAPREVTGLVDRRALLADRSSPGRPMVLAGNGGVGKTELAAHELRSRSPAIAVWVSASTRSAVLGAFRSVAGQLRLDVDDDDEVTADRLLTHLRHTEVRWLIVLDDVAEFLQVHDLLAHGPAGMTIVTTRWTTSVVDASADIVRVDVYELEEACAFLGARFRGRSSPGSPEEAVELARELGFLPLALAHAAAVIMDDDLSYAEYLELLRSDRTIEELMPSDPGEVGSGYGTTVGRAWQLALHRADTRSPVGLASPLWRVISCLDPNGVPQSALLSEPLRESLSDVGVRSLSRAKVKKAISNLIALSLAQRTPDDLVRTHILSQRVTRESLLEHELVAAGSTAAACLLSVWPDGVAERVRVDTLTRNLDALRRACPRSLWEPDANALLYGHGRLLGRSGRATQAARYFAELAAESADRLGSRHADTMLARREHAVWTAEAGENAEAIALIDALSALSGSPVAIGLAFVRAKCVGRAGDAAAARAGLADVLVRARADPGASHDEVLAIEIEHARWVAVAGEPERALRSLKKVVRQARSTSSGQRPDHTSALVARAAAAECLEHAGGGMVALAEGGALADDAESHLGRTATHTLTYRHRLACAEERSGTVQAAAGVQRRLYDDMVVTFDEDDPRIAAARVDLARYLGMDGDGGLAVSSLVGALDEQRRRGVDERELLDLRETLAKWRGRYGRPDLAIRDYGELLLDARRLVGDDDGTVLLIRYQLIHWTGVHDGDIVEQEEALRSLLVDVRRVLGSDCDLADHCEHQLLACRRKRGEDVSAAMEDLLATLTRSGRQHGRTGRAILAQLLDARVRRGDPEAARAARVLLSSVAARDGEAAPIAQLLRSGLQGFRAGAGSG